MKFLLLPTFAFILASCATKPEDEKEDSGKNDDPKPIVIGRVASVSKAGQFVLIQKFGPAPLAIGDIYQSRGLDNRSASLRPSGERIRDFFAADLVSGTVEKGDAVIAYSKALEDEKSSPAPTDIPANEDVQDEQEESETAADPGLSVLKNNQDTETIKE